MRIERILLVVFGFFLVLPLVSVADNNYVIDDNRVYIDDSRAYISAEPHTLASSGWVYFNITSKLYTGDIDIVFGFDTNFARPIKAELYKPHIEYWSSDHEYLFENVTLIETTSQTCTVGNEYNTYRRKVTYICTTCSNNESSETKTDIICFDSYNKTGNNYNVYWHTDHNKYVEWVDYTNTFESVNYDFRGMNKWYYVKNIPINAGNSYLLRGYVSIPMSLNSHGGKYWFALKPSSESISEAISSDHLYYLDPWYGESSYSKCRNLTINNTEVYSQVAQINITGLSGSITASAIVNAACDAVGSEIPAFILGNTNNSLNIQFKVPSPGASQVFSIYYDNITAVTPNRNYDWLYDHFTSFDTNRWGTVVVSSSLVGGTSGHILQINTTNKAATCANMGGIYYKYEDITDFATYPFKITGRWTRGSDQCKLGLVQWTGSAISLFATLTPANNNYFAHYIDSTCGAGSKGSGGGTYPTFFRMVLNNTDATHTFYEVYTDAGVFDWGYTHTHDDSSTATFGGGFGDNLASNSFYIDWVCVNCNATTVIPTVTVGNEMSGGISLLTPLNTTYMYDNMSLNVSSGSSNIDKWWYSLDNGDTNVTFTPNTTFMASLGHNTIIVYANTTEGEKYSITRSFTYVLISIMVYQYASVYNYSNSTINWSLAVVVVNNHTTNLSNINVDISDNFSVSNYTIPTLKSGNINISYFYHQWTRGNVSNGESDYIIYVAPAKLYKGVNGTSNNLSIINPVDPPTKGSVAAQLEYYYNISDLADLSDNSQKLFDGERKTGDSFSLSTLIDDIRSFQKDIFDSYIFSFVSDGLADLGRIINEGFSSSDAKNDEYSGKRTETETARMSDANTQSYSGTRTVSDTFDISTVIKKTADFGRTIFDSYIFNWGGSWLKTVSGGLGTSTTSTTTPPSGGGGGGGGTNTYPAFVISLSQEGMQLSRGEKTIIKYNVTNIGLAGGDFIPECVGNCEFVRNINSIYIDAGQKEETLLMLVIPVNTTPGNYSFILSGRGSSNEVEFDFIINDDLVWLFTWLRGEGVNVMFYDLAIIIKDKEPYCLGNPINYQVFVISNQKPSQDVDVQILITDKDDNPLTLSDSKTIFVGENSIGSVDDKIQTISNWAEGWYKLVAIMTEPGKNPIISQKSIYLDDCKEELPVIKELSWFWGYALMKPVDVPLFSLGEIEVPFLAIIIIIFLVSCFAVFILKENATIWSILGWATIFTTIMSIISFAMLSGI